MSTSHATATSRRPARTGRLARVGASTPVLLLQAAHPRQAVLTALGVAMAAALSGRPLRELGLVFATVLIGQAILGWDNDLVDRARDARHDLPRKPIAAGLLDPGTVWFALTCALLVVVPLAVAASPRAGAAYLVSLLVVLIGHRFGRSRIFALVPWVISFGLYPFYLAYGGWSGTGPDTAPNPMMVVLAALLGLCIHVMRALPGLVPDNQDGYRTLPLRLALRTGAPKLMLFGGIMTAVVIIVMLLVGQTAGLT